MSVGNWNIKGHRNPNGYVFILNPNQPKQKQEVLEIEDLPKVEPIKKPRKGRVKKNV